MVDMSLNQYILKIYLAQLWVAVSTGIIFPVVLKWGGLETYPKGENLRRWAIFSAAHLYTGDIVSLTTEKRN